MDDDYRVRLPHLYHSLMSSGILTHPYRLFAFLFFLILCRFDIKICITDISYAPVYHNVKMRYPRPWATHLKNVSTLISSFSVLHMREIGICTIHLVLNIYVAVPSFVMLNIRESVSV